MLLVRFASKWKTDLKSICFVKHSLQLAFKKWKTATSTGGGMWPAFGYRLHGYDNDLVFLAIVAQMYSQMGLMIS